MLQVYFKRSSHLQDKHRIRLILCLSYVWNESYPISVNSIGFLKILCWLLSYAYPMRILCFSLSKIFVPYPMSLSYAYPMFGFSTQDKHRLVGVNHALEFLLFSLPPIISIFITFNFSCQLQQCNQLQKFHQQ